MKIIRVHLRFPSRMSVKRETPQVCGFHTCWLMRNVRQRKCTITRCGLLISTTIWRGIMSLTMSHYFSKNWVWNSDLDGRLHFRLHGRMSVEMRPTSMCSSYLLAHAERAAAQMCDNESGSLISAIISVATVSFTGTPFFFILTYYF